MKLTEEALNAMRTMIPPHMHGAMIRYFEEGIMPGDFLRAVLENDLYNAINFADHHNKYRLHDYVMWLYNYVPGRPNGGWGSPEAIQAHIERCAKEQECA